MVKRQSIKPIAFSKPYLFKEETIAVAQTLRSGWIVGGPKLAELEKKFAEATHQKYGIGVSSWTTGAFLVLKAWGLGRGDEVIVPSYSFIATANVVTHTGATPVFCDIDPKTFNIDIQHAKQLITRRTRAIIPVDQLGMPCDIEAIHQLSKRHQLHVLQDAACAIGSRYKKHPVGQDAEVAIFSLHARKLVTCGEGGVIVCSDRTLAAKLKLLRHQGMDCTDIERHQAKTPLVESYPVIGYNMRMTDIQASIALVQLKRLPEMLSRRRKVADTYQKKLSSIKNIILPKEPAQCRGNWQSYMISISPKTGISLYALMRTLAKKGIPTRRGIMAAHLEPCYRKKGAAVIPPLPKTALAVKHNLLLPMHPGLNQDQLSHICNTLKDVLN